MRKRQREGKREKTAGEGVGLMVEAPSTRWYSGCRWWWWWWYAVRDINMYVSSAATCPTTPLGQTHASSQWAPCLAARPAPFRLSSHSSGWLETPFDHHQGSKLALGKTITSSTNNCGNGLISAPITGLWSELFIIVMRFWSMSTVSSS